MYCWFCHHGWHPDVRKIYDEASDKLEAVGVDGYCAMNFGRAHIVWADENFDRGSIQRCIERKDDSVDGEEAESIVLWSLQRLLELPDHTLTPPESVAYKEACKNQESTPELVAQFKPSWATQLP